MEKKNINRKFPNYDKTPIPVKVIPTPVKGSPGFNRHERRKGNALAFHIPEIRRKNQEQRKLFEHKMAKREKLEKKAEANRQKSAARKAAAKAAKEATQSNPQ